MSTLNTKLTAVADKIRTLSGTTAELTLDEMATNVNTANTEIDEQTELIAQILAAIEEKLT